MKKLFLDFLVGIIICLILLVALKLFATISGLFIPPQTHSIYQMLQTLIIVFGITGISYKRLWSANLFQRKIAVPIFGLVVILLFFVVYHILSIHKNTVAYYHYINSKNFIAWAGKIYTQDDTLGYKPAPGANGFLAYSNMDAVPVKINEQGFRVPVATDSLSEIRNEVDLLFLGCSFTYGSTCKAEDAFPYVVAKQKNMRYINAGAGGYGLAQMYILSQKLIAKYKPKYVIIQHSPWLIARSVTEFAPSRGGYLLPTPYFSKIKNSITLQHPAFRSTANDLEAAEDRKKYQNKFLLYYFRFGFFYFAKQQMQIVKLRVRNVLGIAKKPTSDIKKAELFAYHEMFKQAKMNGARVILLNLSSGLPSEKYKTILTGNDIVVANADSVLYSYPGISSTEAYMKTFNHWGFNGKDSVFVDSHPNALAHRLIATSIIEKIQ